MGCNCGKNKRVTVQYMLTRLNGTTSLHGTKRSAELADARSGGGGTIEKVG